MKFKDWLQLNEMPITGFGKIGQWEPSDPRRGWDKPSIGILSNDKGIAKIFDAWKNSPVDFDLYFVRQKGAMQHLEKGEVNPEWIKQNLGFEFQYHPDSITVFFTQNLGDQKIPMTAWIIAHRLGHAIGRDRLKVGYGKRPEAGSYPYLEEEILRDFKELLEFGYNYNVTKGPSFSMNRQDYKYIKDLMQALGTFRSARYNNIARIGEFTHELVAQVIMNGKVTFNELPRAIGKRMAWGRPVYNKYSQVHNDEIALDEINKQIQNLARKYTRIITEILNKAVGKVFVM